MKNTTPIKECILPHNTCTLALIVAVSSATQYGRDTSVPKIREQVLAPNKLFSINKSLPLQSEIKDGKARRKYYYQRCS
jgi:hypothetical protein